MRRGLISRTSALAGSTIEVTQSPVYMTDAQNISLMGSRPIIITQGVQRAKVVHWLRCYLGWILHIWRLPEIYMLSAACGSDPCVCDTGLAVLNRGSRQATSKRIYPSPASGPAADQSMPVVPIVVYDVVGCCMRGL